MIRPRPRDPAVSVDADWPRRIDSESVRIHQIKPTPEPCIACERMVYKRIVLTSIVVHFDTALYYDGTYYYNRRHRCQTP